MEVTLPTNGAAPVSGGKAVTAFVCANSSARSAWDFAVHEIAVACAGRLQPEHVLKAFESGADLVFTVSCENDDCHYLQGCERWSRRADYVRGILDEIGLGADRLLVFHLPDTTDRVTAVKDAVLHALDRLTPNPLAAAPVEQSAGLQIQPGADDDEE